MGSLGAEPDGCANAGERGMKASKAAWLAGALFDALFVVHPAPQIPGWFIWLTQVCAASALFFGLWEPKR